MVAQAVAVLAGPPILGLQIASLQPSQVAHPFVERADAQLCIRITGGEAHKHADASDQFSPLGPPRPRPRGRRAAEQRDELAAPHRVTAISEGPYVLRHS